MPAIADDAQTSNDRVHERMRMVDEQIVARGIRDERLLKAIREVPRHEFVPEAVSDFAYDDRPLPIGFRQTISQPFIVAIMTEMLDLDGDEKVLEIGTGSGYQAAVLARLARQVYSIEIVPELAKRARRDLERVGFRNVRVREGDGYRGWPEYAPFDAIIVTAAPDHIPQPLIDQLAVGGRMIVPVGAMSQQLVLLVRTADGVERKRVLDVRFVPMTGEARQQK